MKVKKLGKDGGKLKVPKIIIDKSIDRSYYDPIENLIVVNKKKEINGEYAHYLQNKNNELTTQNELALKPTIVNSEESKAAYYDRRSKEMDNIVNNFDDINSYFDKNTKTTTPFLNNDVKMYYADQAQYALPGTSEYEAHQEIEPELNMKKIKKFADGGVNRYDVPAQSPTGQQYFQLPYNELATALLSKQKLQDKKEEESLGYLDFANKLQALPQDSPVKQEIVQKINSGVDELQNIDLTSNEGKQKYNQLRGYIKQEFGSTGRANAVQSNYLAYQDWLKRQQENYKSKNITQQQLEASNNYFTNQYKGIGKLNPLTANYNQFKANDIAEYVDPAKFVDEYLKGTEGKARQLAYAKTGNDGYLHEGTDYQEVLTPEELATIGSDFINGDPKISNYLAQGVETGLFDKDSINKGLFEYKTSKTKDGKSITQLDFNEKHPFGLALRAGANKYDININKSTRNIKDDSGYWKKKELADANQEDIIDAGTWKSGAFSADVQDAGEGLGYKTMKSLGFINSSPKYEQFNKEYLNKKSTLNQLIAKRKSNTTDIGLENKIKSTQADIEKMSDINKKLDEIYDESYKKTNDGKFELKPYVNPNWDDATKAEVLSKQKNQMTARTSIDKAKFFETHLNDISRAVTQYQRGVKIDNPSIDFEIGVGLTSQKGKRVYGNNGEQLDADFAIPTGYITKLSGTDEGLYNLSNAYFTDKNEARKANTEVVQMSGKEANEDLTKTQAAASSKGNTIPLSLYPEDAKVYKVKTYSEASTATKRKYENMLYNKDEQEVSNKLNSNMKAGLGGLIKMNDNIAIGFDSESSESPYYTVVSKDGETQTLRFPDETSAIKFAHNIKEKL